MDERIRFETKEESTARREREFMALSPHERLQWFLRSFDHRGLQGGQGPDRSGNFIVRKGGHAVR